MAMVLLFELSNCPSLAGICHCRCCVVAAAACVVLFPLLLSPQHTHCLCDFLPSRESTSEWDVLTTIQFMTESERE